MSNPSKLTILWIIGFIAILNGGYIFCSENELTGEPTTITASYLEKEPASIATTWSSESPSKIAETGFIENPTETLKLKSPGGPIDSLPISRDSTTMNSLPIADLLPNSQPLPKHERRAPKARSGDVVKKITTITETSPSVQSTSTWLPSSSVSSVTPGGSGIQTWTHNSPASVSSWSSTAPAGGTVINTQTVNTVPVPSMTSRSSVVQTSNLNPMPTGGSFNSWSSGVQTSNLNPMPNGASMSSLATHLPPGNINTFATNPLPLGHANSRMINHLPPVNPTMTNSWSAGRLPGQPLPIGVPSNGLAVNQNNALIQGQMLGKRRPGQRIANGQRLANMKANPAMVRKQRQQFAVGSGPGGMPGSVGLGGGLGGMPGSIGLGGGPGGMPGSVGLGGGPGGMVGVRRKQGQGKQGLSLTPNKSFGIMDRIGMMFNNKG